MAGLINTISGSIPSTGLSSNIAIKNGNNESGRVVSSIIEQNATIMNNSVNNLNKTQHQQQQNVEYLEEEQNYTHHLPAANTHNLLLTASTIKAPNTNNSSNNLLTKCEDNTPTNTYLWIVTPVAAR